MMDNFREGAMAVNNYITVLPVNHGQISQVVENCNGFLVFKSVKFVRLLIATLRKTGSPTVPVHLISNGSSREPMRWWNPSPATTCSTVERESLSTQTVRMNSI